MSDKDKQDDTEPQKPKQPERPHIGGQTIKKGQDPDEGGYETREERGGSGKE